MTDVPFPWEEPAFTSYCLKNLAVALSSEREPSLQLVYKQLAALLNTLSTAPVGLVQPDATLGVGETQSGQQECQD